MWSYKTNSGAMTTGAAAVCHVGYGSSGVTTPALGTHPSASGNEGISICSSSSRERIGCWGRYAVGLLVAEHGEQDVAAAGQADECGVVFLALGSFEALVPGAGWELASDAGAGASGDRRQAGVGGEVSGCGELGGVTDVEEDPCCGPDPDIWHRGQGP